VTDDHAGDCAGRGQAGLTGQAHARRRSRHATPGAKLDRGAWAEQLVAREQVDGAAAADTLAPARLSEREACVTHGVEQRGLGGRAELGHREGDRAAPGLEHDLGHA